MLTKLGDVAQGMSHFGCSGDYYCVAQTDVQKLIMQKSFIYSLRDLFREESLALLCISLW